MSRTGGTVNANRKYTTDPLVKVGANLPESVVAKMDRIRGKQTRTEFIVNAVQEAIRQDLDAHIEALKAKVGA